MKNAFILFLIGYTLYLCSSCANIAPPRGGDKDTLRPKVSRTYPTNYSLNFKGNTIKYSFNKWVIENKLKEQIIITPEISKEKYEQSITKNTLTLKFDTGTFKRNTTYYINLREGIKDLTEGNIANNTVLVFSTGAYVDSAELHGTAVLLAENKSERNLSLALYEPTDTFKIEKASPAYLTKTEENGSFKISNIKPSRYLLYAFKDDNNNGKYEPNKEYIAYSASAININDSTSSITLGLVKEDHEKPKVKYIDKKKKNITIVEFNKNPKSFEIYNKSNSIQVYPLVQENRVSLYPSSESSDSLSMILISSDELGNIGNDTLKFPLTYVDTSQARISSLPLSRGQIEPTEIITIKLSKPYKSLQPKISVKTRGKLYSTQELNEIFSIQEEREFAAIKLIPKIKWNDSVQIIVYPGTFTPVSGYIKDTLKLDFTTKNSENFGSIGGSIETTKENVIVQLLSTDNKVVKEVYNQKNFLFEYLRDGDYKLRAVEDLNNNNKWDQGDYRNRTLPEPIHYYTQPIKLKSNWEILDLKISF